MDKICRKCELTKPLSEFYRHKKMADGHLNFCKQCVCERVGIHREINIDRIREYDRNRGRRKSISPYPKKQKNAAQKVGRAIEICVMSRKPCVICGNQKSEGHHQDYNKPYDVVWLCSQHHRRLHYNRFSLIPTKIKAV